MTYESTSIVTNPRQLVTETDGSANRPRFFAGAQSDPRSIAVWTNSLERRSTGWPQVQIRVLPNEATTSRSNIGSGDSGLRSLCRRESAADHGGGGRGV